MREIAVALTEENMHPTGRHALPWGGENVIPSVGLLSVTPAATE
jgi:hypothetical protein